MAKRQGQQGQADTGAARGGVSPVTDGAGAGTEGTQVSPFDGMVLVRVPAGAFLMGSADDDPMAEGDERPQHEVYLDAFWIDKTEVTNAMFERFVEATGHRTTAEREGSAWVWDGTEWSELRGAFWRQPEGPGSDIRGRADHPVVQVSWDDATAYCRWAGRRLPTEADSGRWHGLAAGGAGGSRRGVGRDRTCPVLAALPGGESVGARVATLRARPGVRIGAASGRAPGPRPATWPLVCLDRPAQATASRLWVEAKPRCSIAPCAAWLAIAAACLAVAAACLPERSGRQAPRQRCALEPMTGPLGPAAEGAWARAA